jgi:hypothetical protein
VKPVRYVITVEGRLGTAARAAFGGMTITATEGSRTSLEGELDQSALFGILLKVQSLALELVGVRRVDREGASTLAVV